MVLSEGSECVDFGVASTYNIVMFIVIMLVAPSETIFLRPERCCSKSASTVTATTDAASWLG